MGKKWERQEIEVKTTEKFSKPRKWIKIENVSQLIKKKN